MKFAVIIYYLAYLFGVLDAKRQSSQPDNQFNIELQMNITTKLNEMTKCEVNDVIHITCNYKYKAKNLINMQLLMRPIDNQQTISDLTTQPLIISNNSTYLKYILILKSEHKGTKQILCQALYKNKHNMLVKTDYSEVVLLDIEESNVKNPPAVVPSPSSSNVIWSIAGILLIVALAVPTVYYIRKYRICYDYKKKGVQYADVSVPECQSTFQPPEDAPYAQIIGVLQKKT